MEHVFRPVQSVVRAFRVRSLAVALAAVLGLTFAGTAPAHAVNVWNLDEPALTVAEGVEFSGVVTCVEFVSGSFNTADFSGDIDWGDGTSSAATLTGGGLDSECFFGLEVRGTHTYAVAGTYPLTVHVVEQTETGFTSATRTGTATVTFLPNDLGVSLAASPNPVKNGRVLTYNVQVTNHDNNIVTDAWLTNTLPTQVQFVSMSVTQGSCNAPASGATGTITCVLGSMAGTTHATLTIRVKVVARGGSTLTDSAATGADDPDAFTANNTASVETAVFGRR